ncbi:TPA: Lrp/AsnC family transcriptional regulator [Acinetobacter baumannii]|nr:Lrp/AsnC family transcriptional regulator [Acinetobacter baumannii]
MGEQTENLTPLELKIMRCLQENGRLSNAELAKLVGISTSSCWNHTQRLFKIGAILDVRARINPGMVQRETIVLVGVVLDRSTPDSFQAFEQAAGDLENVLECYLVAGEVDYFLKIRVKDLAAFNRFHSEKIIALPGVRQVRTFFVLNEVKTDGMLAF